jgi:ferredoxin
VRFTHVLNHRAEEDMKKLLFDEGKCVGAGACELAAPDLFQLGDEGVAVVLVPELEDDDRVERGYSAVRACPAMAITIQGARQPATSAWPDDSVSQPSRP